MANKSLNDKFKIPFLSEWVDKKGVKVTVFKIEYAFKRIVDIPIVSYSINLTKEQKEEMKKNKRANMFIKTVIDFKDTFEEIR